MDKVSGRLTVFFEDPWWVGVFERVSDGRMTVCKVTFGAEPKDQEIYELVLQKYYRLQYSPAVAADVRTACHNPKRAQREARKQVRNPGIGTKSQQALQRQHEQAAAARKAARRARREDEKERMFQLKQLKRREKHRGR